jgi:2-polyprenyl-6-methoxyphenol hydroxylase-like FAD-dependent oxidoreductase
MVGWLTISHDKAFVGYGPYVECSHCHKKGWLEIWQYYTQVRPYSVIPLPKQHGSFIAWCWTCHWGEKIKKSDKDRVWQLLEQGKPAIKEVFEKMPEREKQQYLHTLNRLGFSEISRSLSFREESHTDYS